MPKDKKSKSCYTKKNIKKKNSKPVCWDNFTKIQKKEIAGKFDSEVLELIFDHIQENNLNPGVAQFVLIQNAMQMGFATCQNQYLAVIATALNAMATEVEKRVPAEMLEEDLTATKH